MCFSHNVLFAAELDEPEDIHPPGEPLMCELQQAMQAAGWQASELDGCWGSAWCFSCRRGAVELQVAMASTLDGFWLLQIAPARVPGWIGRWRGREPSATRADCYAAAVDLHAILASREWVTIEGWCRSGYPGEGDDESTATPLPWDEE